MTEFKKKKVQACAALVVQTQVKGRIRRRVELLLLPLMPSHHGSHQHQGPGKPGNTVHWVSRYKPSPGVPQSSPTPGQLFVLTEYTLNTSRLSSISSGRVAQMLAVGGGGSACLPIPSPVQHPPQPSHPCIRTAKSRAAGSPHTWLFFSPFSLVLSLPLLLCYSRKVMSSLPPRASRIHLPPSQQDQRLLTARDASRKHCQPAPCCFKWNTSINATGGLQLQS